MRQYAAILCTFLIGYTSIALADECNDSAQMETFDSPANAQMTNNENTSLSNKEENKVAEKAPAAEDPPKLQAKKSPASEDNKDNHYLTGIE